MKTINLTEDHKALTEVRTRWLADPERSDQENAALSALGAVLDNVQGELNRRAAAAKKEAAAAPPPAGSQAAAK